MSGNNFQLVLHSEGREHFEMAIRIGFANAVGDKATHFVRGLPERSCQKCYGSGRRNFRDPKIESDKPRDHLVEVQCDSCRGTGKQSPLEAMILCWHEDKHASLSAVPLPFPMKVKDATDFLWSYLQQCEYPEQPDHDGSNGKGFLVTTGDFWGHIEGLTYGIVMVVPEWQMYGK